jgi:hypothetical protein
MMMRRVGWTRVAADGPAADEGEAQVLDASEQQRVIEELAASFSNSERQWRRLQLALATLLFFLYACFAVVHLRSPFDLAPLAALGEGLGSSSATAALLTAALSCALITFAVWRLPCGDAASCRVAAPVAAAPGGAGAAPPALPPTAPPHATRSGFPFLLLAGVAALPALAVFGPQLLPPTPFADALGASWIPFAPCALVLFHRHIEAGIASDWEGVRQLSLSTYDFKSA